jgi:diguanylate cyclase (GGDEF)-like protein
MSLKSVKKVVLVSFAILFLLIYTGSGIQTTYAAAGKNIQVQKNVLVLHSYNEGLAWTSEQNAGIIDTIEKEYPNASLYVEYMDWKNYPTSGNLSSLYEYYKFKYSEKHLDLIIATDDAAFNFALRNRLEMFSNAPIVFSGVNQDRVAQVSNIYPNFTGVIENIDPTETIKMALKINPSIKKVYVVYDNSESGISTGELVVEKIRAMKLEAIRLNSMRFYELLDTVSKLDSSSIVFFATYYSDVDGNILEFNMASKEISRYSSVPLYHQYEFGLNMGAFGGDMLSGRLCGKYAANLALRILKGEDADNIPVISPKATRVVFDYNQLKRFNVPLKKLPKNAEIINKPFSFFETYKLLVIGVLIAFSLLTLFLIILLIYIRVIKKMRRKLCESNEELTQTYEELVASDEELKHQLDEIRAIQRHLTNSEEKYTYLALHDVLTGLPNRRSLFEDSNMVFCTRQDNKTAFLFIDMDNFKYINDTMGHEFGDELINKASERLTQALGNNGRLYRLGGDEFILVAFGIADKSEAECFTADILNSFKDEFEIRNSALHISFSIGIALFPEHGDNIEDLIKCADIAMYKAKEAGKNTYVVYDKKMNKAFSERMNIEKLLHNAMESNEFELYYQPMLDTETNKITCVEALLRWNSPILGMVSPMKFITVAEDTHLIIPLGDWVMNQACYFISQLRSKGFKELTVAINISTIQLLQSDFIDKVSGLLEHYQLDPDCIELEITESVLIESFTAVSKKLRKLRKMGIGIALDDFGKGYSSLSYLKQLPISTLKIDKSFIDNISINMEDKTITRHIITMGRSLGMTVVAEGVEKQEQLDYLKKYRCDKIQGYLFSKPLPENELKTLLGA